MGKHEASKRNTSLSRRLARHAMHPAAHILTLVSLHVAALAVLGFAQKLPLLTAVLH